MHIRKTLAAGLFAVMAVQNVGATEAPSVLEFVRPLGMGGAFTALADDHNTFTYNPAGMVQRTGTEVTLLEIVGGGSEDTKKALDFLDKNSDKLSKFDKLPANEQAQLANDIQKTMSPLHPHAYFGADVASFVTGPGLKGIHLGAGLFGVADVKFQLYNGVASPLIDYAINSDIQLPISLARRWNAPFHMPGKLGFGLTGKFLQRRQISESRLSVFQLDNFKAPPLATGHGFGTDLGTLYQPTDRLNIGIMVRDFLGTKMKFDARDAEKGYGSVAERETVIHPRTNVGFAVVPKSYLGIGRTNDRLTLAVDVRDVASKEDHVFFQNGLKKPLGDDFATHFHLGAEWRWWFFRFRGGAYQGYPTAGLGIDIPLLKIDYAYFSRELGARAGDIREENHVISIALRFGSGKTESRERIAKAKAARRNEGASAPVAADDGAPGQEAPAAPSEKPSLNDSK